MLGRTVAELKATLSISELQGWVAYLALEPSNSNELQSTLIAQMINNSNGGKAKFEDLLITDAMSNYRRTTTTTTFASDDDVRAVFSIFK